MKNRAFARVLVSLLLLADLLTSTQAFAVVASNPSPVCSGSSCTLTFSVTSDFYSYTVPAGISYFDITIKGGQGGGATGGQGGVVTGRMNVTASTILYLYVGAAGTSGTSPVGGLSGGRSSGGSIVSGVRSDNNSGGAHSEITTSSGTSIVIAGGGGARGGWAGGTGGAGGGSSWSSFISAGQNGFAGQGAGGTGGGASAGSGGSGNGAQAGSSGSGQVGGNGGTTTTGAHGGGGGGGYRGGGGGGGDYDAAGVDGGGGGGGSSFYNSTYFSSAPTTTAGGNSGAGSIVLSYPSTSVSTFTSTQSTPTNTSAGITYSLTMSESVSGMEDGDFENPGTATGCLFSVSGTGSSYSLIVSNCGEGTLIPRLKANSVSGTTTGPSSASPATTTIVIDRSAPTISSVSPPANGTYNPAGALNFTVNFSESVTVTGTPRLTLTLNGSGSAVSKYATFISLSDSKTATFRYTVASDSANPKTEFDSDGIAVSTTLDLNGGSIADLATNAMSTLTFSAVSSGSINIAQSPAAPTIDSITAGNTQLTVYFSAGATYGSAITNYEYSTNNGGSWSTRSPVATTSPVTITSLSNGTTYQVRLRAVSAAGNSDSSTAVSATPTAIVVSGGSDITTTYGSAASSSQFSASGGTSPYTFTLSSTPTGVSISNGIVTASATTAAATYIQNVIATDSASPSKSGTKQITITVNKANQATLTITTTSGIFGTTLTLATSGGSGGGAVTYSYAAGTTTCTLSSTSLSANGAGTCLITATKAADSNYNQVLSTQTTITFDSGSTSATITLASGTLVFRQAKSLSATSSVAGRLTFKANNVVIPGCKNLVANAGNSYTRTCSYKPSTRGYITITVTLNPTNPSYTGSTTRSERYFVTNRSGGR